MTRILAVAVSIAILALTGASSVSAVTGPWLPAADLSSVTAKYALYSAPFLDSSPVMGVAADGTATVVWSDGTVVRAATRPPGGSFSAPIDLSILGQTAIRPQIAVAPDGTALVVWAHTAGAASVIQAVTRAPGGAFTPPVDLSSSGATAEEPQIAIAPDGRAVAAWDSKAGATWTVQVSARAPGGVFGAPESVLVSSNEVLDPRIGIAPDGGAVVVWSRGGIVQAVTRPAVGGIGAPENLSLTDNPAVSPQVAIAPDGTATVAFVRRDLNDVIQSVTRLPGGTFGAPLTHSSGSQDAANPQIAVADDGTAVIAWHRFNSQSDVVQVATRPPGGAFSISPGGSFSPENASKEHVAIGGDGSVAVVWLSDDGKFRRILVSTRPPGGAFSLPVDVSGPGQNRDPRIALGRDGSGVVVLLRSDGTGLVPRAALTANPPSVRTSPSIAGAPAVGSALACQGASFTGAAQQTTSWLRGPDPLASGAGYTVAAADQGGALSCRVRAANPYGSVDAVSAPVAIPAPPGASPVAQPPAATAATAPIARSLPRITGSARVGRTLRCRAASFTGAATRTTGWLRGRTRIRGATRAAYKLTRRDRGNVVACRTTARSAGGTSTVVSLGVLVR